MKKLYKILGLLILILNFNQFTNAKPLPPGSGEGDVPANILILLDSSASMTARIGDGFPALTSAATDWNGNRVFTNASKQDGGLYMVNSSGEKINFSGTKDNGDTYERSIWWANDDTDRTCDNNINHRGRGTNYSVTENRMLHEVRYVTGVTVGGTDISNENLLFIGQYQPKNNRSSIIAVDQQYRCRLAMNIDGVNARGHQPKGFDISNNADGDIIVAAYGRDGKNAYQQTCNLNDGKCAKVSVKGKNQNNQYGRLFDGARFRLNSDSTVMYVSDDNHVWGYQTRISNGVPLIQTSSFEFRKCIGRAGATGTQVRDIQNFDISSSDDDVMYVAGRNNTVQRVEWTSDTVCTAT
ncbi:pilus assembly protein PilY, partial [Pelagibacteraceae bacterium]|nr:pilus assembly protein PilY [Pelagibacteraceae bacterium]